MGTTDANGIYMYADTDPLVPFASLLNTGQASVSAKFAAIDPGLIHYVANTTERTTLVNTFVPTASKPLFVYRGNAPVDRRIEYTADGTSWKSIVVPVTAIGTKTSNQGSIVSLVDLSGLTATVPAQAGDLIQMSYKSGHYSTSVSDVVQYTIVSGSTTLSEMPFPANSGGTATTFTVSGSFFYVVPTTGNFTARMRLQRAAGSGTVTAVASASNPAQFVVRNLGPAS